LISLLAKGYTQLEGIDFIDTFSPVAKLTILLVYVKLTILLVYVDDVILAGNSMTEIDKIKTSLHEAFRIKDLGSLKYFLGFEVARSTKGIHLCQRKYALDILSEIGTLDCKPSQTPLMSNTKVLFDKNDDPIKDSDSYRRLIGKLLYLTNSRPDICYSVHLLSQFVQAPTIYHQQAA